MKNDKHLLVMVFKCKAFFVLYHYDLDIGLFTKEISEDILTFSLIT